MQKRKVGGAVLVLAMVATAFVLQQAARGTTTTYTSTGAFPVPAGVTTISIEAWGAQGGTGGRPSDQTGSGLPGFGARVIAHSVPVTPSESLTITVGTKGGDGSYTFCGVDGVPGGSAGKPGGGSTLSRADCYSTGGGGGG